MNTKTTFLLSTTTISSLLFLAMVTIAAQSVKADPTHCDRPGFPTCYSVGYKHGFSDAKSGTNTDCHFLAGRHSSEFERGYGDGCFDVIHK